MKLRCQRKGHKRQAGWLAWSLKVDYDLCVSLHHDFKYTFHC